MKAPKIQEIEIICDRAYKVYPHKDCTCYYEAYNLLYLPRQDEGIIGGFFDELIRLKKGKKYRITVKEIK